MTQKNHIKISRSSVEALVFTIVFFAIFVPLGIRMGGENLLNTIMRTAHGLLLNTVFYLMSITVLTGALAKLMSEFGLVSIIGRVLKPLMNQKRLQS